MSSSSNIRPSLVAARRTALARTVFGFGAAPDAGDLLHEQSEFLLEFEDPLSVLLNLLQQGIEFGAGAL